jgi:hypothetical protein
VERERLLLEDFGLLELAAPAEVMPGQSRGTVEQEESVGLLASWDQEMARTMEPIRVGTDGNCMYQAICQALHLSYEHHHHLRLLVSIEIARNRETYDRSCSLAQAYLDESVVLDMFPYSQVLSDAVTNHNYSGMVHIYAASEVLGRPIRVTYPDISHAEFNLLARGCTVPVEKEHLVHLMWTRVSKVTDVCNLNHFVPLVWKSKPDASRNTKAKPASDTTAAEMGDTQDSRNTQEKSEGTRQKKTDAAKPHSEEHKMSTRQTRQTQTRQNMSMRQTRRNTTSQQGKKGAQSQQLESTRQTRQHAAPQQKKCVGKKGAQNSENIVTRHTGTQQKMSTRQTRQNTTSHEGNTKTHQMSTRQTRQNTTSQQGKKGAQSQQLESTRQTRQHAASQQEKCVGKKSAQSMQKKSTRQMKGKKQVGKSAQTEDYSQGIKRTISEEVRKGEQTSRNKESSPANKRPRQCSPVSQRSAAVVVLTPQMCVDSGLGHSQVCITYPFSYLHM